jgi:hypothetical protein
MSNSVTIRFNPTATAIQATNDNHDEVKETITSATGKSFNAGITEGKYYVAFMGELFVMDDAQFRAAQGLV